MKNYLFISLIFLSSCSWINQQLGLKDDNWIEESAEFVIKVETGVDVDLTPGTPE